MRPEKTRAIDGKNVRGILETLASLPADAGPAQRWDAFSAADWPALIELLDLAADLPRLASNQTLSAFPGRLWPELDGVRSSLFLLQELVDHPTVPAVAQPAPEHGIDELDAAVKEIETNHCVHVDFLLDEADQKQLDREIEVLSHTRLGMWGELERDAAPGIYDLFERGLGGDRFRRLTGFDLERDEYTLTLSLQDLQPAGIGWHRDLYWPKEWVGEDVFAVLYSLGVDTPEKGGAFLYFAPLESDVLALYRKRHQATIMWNSADPDGRLIHAVSEYLTPDTSRHLIILQCHRRAR